MEVYARIRRSVQVDGMSIRQASREFGLSRASDRVRRNLAASVSAFVFRLLPWVENAFVTEQGRPGFPTRASGEPGKRHRHSPGWRAASPIRTPRRLNFAPALLRFRGDLCVQTRARWRFVGEFNWLKLQLFKSADRVRNFRQPRENGRWNSRSGHYGPKLALVVNDIFVPRTGAWREDPPVREAPSGYAATAFFVKLPRNHLWLMHRWHGSTRRGKSLSPCAGARKNDRIHLLFQNWSECLEVVS